MIRTVFTATLLLNCAGALALSQSTLPDQQWFLDKSTLTYHMSHPMHQVEGVSHDARGKGICHAGQCDILIAVPVKSFASGDTNRDLHMLEATHGAQFPIVVIRAHFAESEIATPWVHANLDIQFAGHTAHYSSVPFALMNDGNRVHITGSVPATCSDFKIDRPSFLTVPIKIEIPIRVDLLWHRN